MAKADLISKLSDLHTDLQYALDGSADLRERVETTYWMVPPLRSLADAVMARLVEAQAAIDVAMYCVHAAIDDLQQLQREEKHESI